MALIRSSLATRHMRSLQLLCTVGGDQARSDARSEFEISQRSLKGGVKLVVNIAVTTFSFLLLFLSLVSL